MYLTAVAMAALVAVGQVNESSSSQSPLEEEAWLIGTWEAEYDLPSGVPELGKGGEKVKEVLSWRWALDKKFIVLRFSMEIEGQPPFTGLEVTGLNPKSGQVTSSLFNSTGAQGRGEWDKEGDTLTMNWTAIQPDKTVFKGVSYIRQDSKDEYTWGIKNLTRGGEEIADWGPVTYRKRPNRQNRDR
jgi:hypothetical protein